MKIGLIGLKGHQGTVLEGAAQLGNCQVVAVADANLAAAEAFVRREPLAAGAQAYADWRHLLEHTPLDVCCLADESGVRAEQLLALISRGIHIVSEKPLTTTLADLERVQRALQGSSSRLTMLLTMRHEAKYAAMHRLVRGGAIGTVCLATAQKSYRLGQRPDWQRSRARLGGTIPYIGVHSLDLIRWITGLEFTQVAAFHGNLGKPEMKETEDHASLLLRLSNGGSATARLDYLRPLTAPTHADDRLRIAGSEGVIEVQGGDEGPLLITSQEPPRRIKVEPTDNLFVDFVHSLKEQKDSRIPAADCLAITRVVLLARDAADQRRLVDIPPWT